MILAEVNAPSDWVLFFGHFHPLVVHLPIGILAIAFILEILSRQQRLKNIEPAIAPILFFGTISAGVSCLFGWLLSQSGEYDSETLFWHQWMGIGVAVVSLAAWYMKKNWSADLKLSKLYMPAVYLIMILMTGTGHLGGNMTHGSDYLTAFTPEPFRSLAGIPPRKEANSTGEVRKIENIAEAVVYRDLVEPVMQQKCWSCHNEDKQKGKLRMDTPEFLMKGGEDGSIVTPGNAAGSEMLKRLLLDAGDEHHMPPKGKTPLTEDEIALVHWWIQSGAGFDKKVAQMPKEDKVKSYLASIGSGGGSSTSGPTESAVFKEKVSAASEQEIKKLTDLNALVMPVAKEQNFLEANFINAKGFDDSKAPLLGGLSEQLVWLKLGRTNISDKAMDEIARLKNLSKLHLEHTGISDAGIAKLKDMKYLEYINLFDTRVTDAGIKELAKLKSLKKVYVWQTKVTRSGIEMLKKAIPGVEVDSGWEMKVPVPADSAQKESLARK